MKVEIMALQCHEFVVGSHFLYLSIIQHNDFIGLPNGREAVRNYNGGAATDEFVNGMLN
jgi:hypothetical protein